jgi:hypothetical protein
MNIQEVQQHLQKYSIPATVSHIIHHDGPHSLDRYKLSIPRVNAALLATIPMIRIDPLPSTGTLRGTEAVAFFGRHPVVVYQSSRLWVCSHCGALDNHSKANCPYKGVKYGEDLPNPFTNQKPRCMTCAATHIDCRQKLSSTTIKALKCFICNKLGHTPRKCPAAFPTPLPIDEYVNRSNKRQMKRQRRTTKLYTAAPPTSTETGKKRQRPDSETPYLQAARKGNTNTPNSTSEVEELKAQLKAALQLNQQLTKRVEQLELRASASAPPSHLELATPPTAAPTSTAQTESAPPAFRGRKKQTPAKPPTDEATIIQLATSVQQIKQWMNIMSDSMTEVKASVQAWQKAKQKNTFRVKLPTKPPVTTTNQFAPLSQPIDVEADSEATSSSSTSANPSSYITPHDL